MMQVLLAVSEHNIGRLSSEKIRQRFFSAAGILGCLQLGHEKSPL